MGQLKGVAVNFAFTGTDGIAEATILTGKMQLQSAEFETMADEEQVKGPGGALANRSFYNPGYKTSLEYIPSGAAIADAITNTAVPEPGTILSITACASMPMLIKTNWVVQPGGKVVGSNTTAKRINITVESHAGITAVVT